MASPLQLPPYQFAQRSCGGTASHAGQRLHQPPSPSCQPSSGALSSFSRCYLKGAKCQSLYPGNGFLEVVANTKSKVGNQAHATRSEQNEAAEEKPRRRRAAPRVKEVELEGGEEPVKKPTRGGRKQADEGGDESVPRRRAPRKKAETEDESVPSSRTGTTRRRRKKVDEEHSVSPLASEAGQQGVRSNQQDIISGQQEIIDKQQEIIDKQQEIISDQQNERDGNGAAVRKEEHSENGSSKLVVGELVEDTATVDVLGDEDELKRIAQKIVDGRARDLKLRPELDKLLDLYFMQECTKCNKVFVGRRPAPEQPYYGICRRPSDSNRWRNEPHNIVDTHVPSAITQPYVITHKLGDQTRYRYRVPAILAICQMAGATFPSTDNEFFDCIRRHDSRYEPFHIGVLNITQPPPPGGWRKDDAELLSTDSRAKKLRLLRLDGYEFQDTYLPEDTGMTSKTFADRSEPLDEQGDWNAITRHRDPYRPK